jgi:hypothetical protein
VKAWNPRAQGGGTGADDLFPDYDMAGSTAADDLPPDSAMDCGTALDDITLDCVTAGGTAADEFFPDYAMAGGWQTDDAESFSSISEQDEGCSDLLSGDCGPSEGPSKQCKPPGQAPEALGGAKGTDVEAESQDRPASRARLGSPSEGRGPKSCYPRRECFSEVVECEEACFSALGDDAFRRPGREAVFDAMIVQVQTSTFGGPSSRFPGRDLPDCTAGEAGLPAGAAGGCSRDTPQIDQKSTPYTTQERSDRGARCAGAVATARGSSPCSAGACLSGGAGDSASYVASLNRVDACAYLEAECIKGREPGGVSCSKSASVADGSSAAVGDPGVEVVVDVSKIDPARQARLWQAIIAERDGVAPEQTSRTKAKKQATLKAFVMSRARMSS